jgi:demethylmenaquinone methyltransferase/2-methoxy-6-polyprenyl-1,4-benzoquinol methylase
MEGVMPSAPDKTPSRIAGMFDAIAPRYDLLNHLLSAGLDRRWRERAVDALELTPGMRLLDLCTGTADVAIAAARRPTRPSIVGIDFAATMLTLGLQKVRDRQLDRQIQLIRGDATRIPVADETCQAATIAFGIRNVAEPEKAIAELARVLTPGGRLAILEFGAPRVPGIRTMYDWYFRYLLPLVGRTVSKHQSAYSYLPASVTSFPPPAEFARMLSTHGFQNVTPVPLTLGIVYLYTAIRA